ncbi:MAG: hypothetical protein EA397_02025 [Deltaproteobacteria bacterium]|nr:MAG: hypothetical protein EA397_02025 [Deltaproteobacteria bacterium]
MRSILLVLLLGCAEPAPLTQVRPANDSTPLIAGQPGPFGVGRTSWRAPARVTERVHLEVHVPLDDDGEIVGPTHAVVLLSGGLVRPDRYRWMSEHLASRGFAVIVPTPPANLALFAPGNAREALHRVREASMDGGPLHGLLDERPAAVTGHSLGGVTAAEAWAADPEDFSTLGIIAAYPTGTVRPDRRPDSPMLSITGETDERADPDRIRAGFERFVGPRLFAEVQGLNHYDWADEVSQAELDRDGPRLRPVEEARLDAMRVFDTWLDAALREDPEAWEAFTSADFDGVEVAR